MEKIIIEIIQKMPKWPRKTICKLIHPDGRVTIYKGRYYTLPEGIKAFCRWVIGKPEKQEWKEIDYYDFFSSPYCHKKTR